MWNSIFYYQINRKFKKASDQINSYQRIFFDIPYLLLRTMFHFRILFHGLIIILTHINPTHPLQLQEPHNYGQLSLHLSIILWLFLPFKNSLRTIILKNQGIFINNFKAICFRYRSSLIIYSSNCNLSITNLIFERILLTSWCYYPLPFALNSYIKSISE